MFAIETQNLCKQFKHQKALDGLNLQIPEGSVFGLLGPNGAGKTTFLRIVMGFAKASEGDVLVNGKSIMLGKSDYKKNLGFLCDVPAFYGWMKAIDYLKFVAELSNVNKNFITERVSNLLKTAGLNDVNTPISGFSRGMKQRLGIAQALIHNPKIVLLDEPTSALDPIGRKEVLEMISGFANDITVVFSTHILTDIERVCNHVAILNHGKLMIQESMSSLKTKYAEAIIQIHIIGDEKGFLEKLTKQPWFLNSEKKEETLRLSVSNLSEACYKIPQMISELNSGIVRMEQAEINLEDIFVNLINNENV